MIGFTALPQPTTVENTWASPATAFVIAGAIFAVVTALVFSARRDIRTSSDFLLGGRKIGIGLNTLAMVGTGLMYSTVIIIASRPPVNPSAFRIATSLPRSRTDMAMVLPRIKSTITITGGGSAQCQSRGRQSGARNTARKPVSHSRMSQP